MASVVDAIRRDTSDPNVQMAMLLGSLMEGGSFSGPWGANMGDPGGSYGPFQINLGSHPGVTAAQANDPDWATQFMLPEYTAAVGKVGAGAFQQNPEQAAEQAAFMAERPAKDYFTTQGRRNVGLKYDEARQAMGGAEPGTNIDPSASYSAITGFDQLTQALQSQIAPEQALYNEQIGALGTGQSLALADLQQKLAYQQSLADLKKAGIERRQGEFGTEKELTQKEQGINRFNLDRQRQLQIGQEMLARQMLGLQGSELGLQKESNQEQYRRQDISDTMLKAQEQFAGGQYERSRQSEMGSAAARGAFYSPGLTNALNALGAQRQLQEQGFQSQEQTGLLNRQDIGRAGKGLDIRQQRLDLSGQGEQLSEQLAGLGYDVRSQQMDIANQLSNLGMNETQASFGDALKQLDLSNTYRQQQGAAGAAEIPIQFQQQMLDIMQKQAALQGGVSQQALGLAMSSPQAVQQAYGAKPGMGGGGLPANPMPPPVPPPKQLNYMPVGGGGGARKNF